MPEDACALVCGIISVICVILFGRALFTGDWSGMIVVTVLGGIMVLLSGYALIMQHHR